jgi:hypothetical protein
MSVNRFVFPTLYVLVTLALLAFLWEKSDEFFAPIARPIFGSYRAYDYFLYCWVVFTLLHWVPNIGKYLFVAVNAVLLSNAYFALILMLYIFAPAVNRVPMWGIPVIAVNVLMALKKWPPREIVFLNAVIALACLPLALQYAVIAIHKGPWPLN